MMMIYQPIITFELHWEGEREGKEEEGTIWRGRAGGLYGICLGISIDGLIWNSVWNM